MHLLFSNTPTNTKPHLPGRASEISKAARPFLRDQTGKSRSTAPPSQQTHRYRALCSDVALKSDRCQYIACRAVQLAEPQLAEPDSISSRPVAVDNSSPLLGGIEAAQAARDIPQKLVDSLNMCSEAEVPANVQQRLQSNLDQQQLLVTWLESGLQQEPPSAAAVASPHDSNAASGLERHKGSITAAAVASAPAGSTSAPASGATSAAGANSSITSSSRSKTTGLSGVQSLAEGFLGPLDSPTSSVDDPRIIQQPRAIWAGVAATRGQKKSMEDCHALHFLHPERGVQYIAQCSNNYDHSSSTFLAGVYDGHGGRSTAAYAAAQLPLMLHRELCDSSSRNHGAAAVDHQQLLSSVFHQLDRSWANHGHVEQSGSTAVTALINKNNLLVANAGDSVAVLARDGSSHRLTESHKLSHPAELERISALGGILVRDKAGNLRLMQSPLRIRPYVAPMTLAVTRGFGDYGFKGVGGDLVIPTPHIQQLELSPDDQVLLLTSDGVTDVMGDDDMMEVAINAINKARDITGEGSDLSCAAAAAVKDAAMAAGAWDNLTVVAVLLDWNK